MWKQLCRNPITKRHCRTFLSDAYQCTEAWQSRLQTPILQQIKLEPFLHEIDRKFQLQGKVCAIDIDILVNKVDRSEHLEDIAHLVHRLRMTEETTNALDSTSHAVIRNYLDYGNEFIEDLVRILDDRLSYGVFLDTYTANLLLDRLLRANNYRLAAKVASNLMLQEDFDNEISRNFSLLACYKYAQAPVPFEEPIKVAAEVKPIEEASKSTAKSSKKKKVEEIRVRVPFVRNDYFDDHFDIKNSEHLAGKTLVMAGRQTPGTLGQSAQLIGLCLYQKYEDGCKFVDTIATAEDIHKDAVDLVKLHLSKVRFIYIIHTSLVLILFKIPTGHVFEGKIVHCGIASNFFLNISDSNVCNFFFQRHVLKMLYPLVNVIFSIQFHR